MNALATGDVTEVPVHWGVHEDVYCAGKESTFEFLEGVLKEVISLFPSQYIHIGGDEVSAPISLKNIVLLPQHAGSNKKTVHLFMPACRQHGL